MPVRLREDPLAEGLRAGAYVSLARELYCVVGFEQTGPRAGVLRCVNCRDESPVELTYQESRVAVLVRRAPVG